MQPSEIEALSFRIIDEEAGAHSFDDREWAVIRRMIHTSADFEYMQTTRIYPQAIDVGIGALRDGRNIVTDTNMARAGIRKSEIYRFGGSVECLIDDATVAQAAPATPHPAVKINSGSSTRFTPLMATVTTSGVRVSW